MDSSIHVLDSIQRTRLAAVGSATVLVYDHFITIDQEINLVWKKDWSFLKCVFIFHRYLGFLCVMIELFATLSPHVSDDVSAFWFHWEMWGYTVVVLTSELVLLLWIFVVYNRKVHILAFLGVLWTAELISVVVILAKSFARLQITANLIPGLGNFCSLINEPPFFYWYWLPVLLYNSAILVLFVHKGTEILRVSHVSLLHDVYRRSFVNFLAIFVAYLLCCVLWLTANFSLGQIPVGFALSFSITNSTRLLINIRHAYYMREEVDLDRPIAAIYANETPREEWLFELREMRLLGR
ncbi:hypothetical protein B0H17DRAFT_1081781 [Mycena rosella]|uniref:DUF6533 domain-containing protein n=1 Tax=Mycena rosella TaxID=1033263 RepID=A0AAD7D1U9_MYCRO|nr:hypothetical protein B0H17DRAFT_1081781 [Mycena rosella]